MRTWPSPSNHRGPERQSPALASGAFSLRVIVGACSLRAGDLLEPIAEELVAEITAADEDRRVERPDVVLLRPAGGAGEAPLLAPRRGSGLAATPLAVEAVVQTVHLVHREA